MSFSLTKESVKIKKNQPCTIVQGWWFKPPLLGLVPINHPGDARRYFSLERFQPQTLFSKEGRMKKKGMTSLAAMIMMLFFSSTAVFGFNWGVCDKCGDKYDDKETNCLEKLEAATENAAKKKEKARDKAIDKAEKKYNKCVSKAWNKFGKCCAKKMKGKYQKGKSARDLKDEMESIEKWTTNLRNACHQKYGEKCADKCGDDLTDDNRPCFEKCFDKLNACLDRAKKHEPKRVNDAYKQVFVIK